MAALNPTGPTGVTIETFLPTLRELAVQVTKPRLEIVLRAGAIMAASDVRNNFAKSVSPEGVPWRRLAYPRINSKGDDKPLRDTGILMASVYGRSDGNSITVGTNLIYAALHQFGGVVRPVKAKWLAIPLTKEAKRAGSARRFPNPLRCVISKTSGKGVLLDTDDEVQYALVKEVKVPARPFLGFSPTFLERMERLLMDEIAKGVSSVREVR